MSDKSAAAGMRLERRALLVLLRTPLTGLDDDVGFGVRGPDQVKPDDHLVSEPEDEEGGSSDLVIDGEDGSEDDLDEVRLECWLGYGWQGFNSAFVRFEED